MQGIFCAHENPLGATYKVRSTWDCVIAKIESRFVGWKKTYLSKGRTITLIKSLSNLPTYFLSLFPLPVGVAYQIEKIFRAFLWGETGEAAKYQLVRWDKTCSLISRGGLGIHKLSFSNEALLGKWLWWYHQGGESLWRAVIDSKYESAWGVGILMK